MPYYLLEKCSGECREGVEAIIAELNLVEDGSSNSEIKSWFGPCFKRGSSLDSNISISYSEQGKSLIIIQTGDHTSHKQEDVKGVIKKFIDICKPETIGDFDNNRYDLREFE